MDEKLPSYVKVTIIVEGDDYETKILIPKALEPVLSHEEVDDPWEDLNRFVRTPGRVKLNLAIEPLLLEKDSLYTVTTTSFGKEI